MDGDTGGQSHANQIITDRILRFGAVLYYEGCSQMNSYRSFASLNLFEVHFLRKRQLKGARSKPSASTGLHSVVGSEEGSDGNEKKGMIPAFSHPRNWTTAALKAHDC